MKILTLIPPYIPSYFNAGHHLPVFQVATYLQQIYPNYTIDSIDAAVLNIHWKNICDLLIKGYDVICLLCDFDGVDTLDRMIYYIRQIGSVDTKIILFGRLCKQSPDMFLKYDVNAIHIKGDYEPGIEEYIRYLNNNQYRPKGILMPSGYRSEQAPEFPVEKWVMPDIYRIPYKEYNHMYSNDLDKFCGIPERQELVVPIARGCPINCSFCDVPLMQGKNERRYDVHKTLEYIKNSFAALPFQYVTFYSPTFTLNHNWVKQLCGLLTKEPRRYPWKCTTALPTLNSELIEIMSKAGCVRISLGIESFSPKVSISLPKCKRESKQLFDIIIEQCNKHGIELNCFIILGLPGDTPEEAEYTIKQVMKAGARVRQAIYSPYHLLSPAMDGKQEFFKFNRQIFYEHENLTREDISKYYNLFYNNVDDRPTRVMEKIS